MSPSLQLNIFLIFSLCFGSALFSILMGMIRAVVDVVPVNRFKGSRPGFASRCCRFSTPMHPFPSFYPLRMRDRHRQRPSTYAIATLQNRTNFFYCILFELMMFFRDQITSRYSRNLTKGQDLQCKYASVEREKRCFQRLLFCKFCQTSCGILHNHEDDSTEQRKHSSIHPKL